MALQLIPMCLHTAKVICTTMNVQHDPLIAGMVFTLVFPLIVIAVHLNPLRLQFSILIPRAAPLPPLLTPNTCNAIRTQLFGNCGSRRVQELVGNCDPFDLHPVRSGDALGSELLDILDGALGAEGDEFADDGDAFIVGQMDGGLALAVFPMQVLVCQ